MTSSPEQEGPSPSGLLAELLEAEAGNERDLAAARAQGARIVEEERERQRREDEALAREMEEAKHSVRERLEAARNAELASLAAQGTAHAAALVELTGGSAEALATEIVKRLVEEAAEP